MKTITDVLIDGVWTTQQPTLKGQRVRQTTYFDDGGFGVVEFVNQDEVADMRITNLAFENRMTREERKAIRRAALTDEDVEDFVGLANKAEYKDLSWQQTIDAVNALEQMGLLAAGRANEILTAPILEHERFKG